MTFFIDRSCIFTTYPHFQVSLADTVAKFTMKWSSVLLKGFIFQILCSTDSSRPEDGQSKITQPDLYATHTSPLTKIAGSGKNILSSMSKVGPGVIRATERELHLGKNEINESLHSAQSEAKDAIEHQYGRNSELRITLRMATSRRVGLVITDLNGQLIKPECQ